MRPVVLQVDLDWWLFGTTILATLVAVIFACHANKLRGDLLARELENLRLRNENRRLRHPPPPQ
jgi:hypothetical protein